MDFRGAAMIATAELLELKPQHAPPLLIPAGSAEDDIATLTYAALVGLASDPVDPACIPPAALVLKCEGHIDLPGITFGSSYELDVRSIELDRGLASAVDAGLLTIRAGKVTLTAHGAGTLDRAAMPHVPRAAARTRGRADELFALDTDELERVARHYLLCDAGR